MDAAQRRQIKADTAQRLASEPGDLPVSSVGRLGRLGLLSARRGVRAAARKLTRRASGGASDTAAVEKTVAALGRLKGLPMKVGQLMSYADLSLPEETRAALSVLQTSAQPLAFELIRSVVAAELGERAPALLKTLEPAPLAVASIGQVHRAALPDGTAVAVKVRYPGVDKAVERDIRPAAIGARITTWLGRATKRDVFVREARARILEECDYVHEARRQREFATRFAGHPTVWIPEVFSNYSARCVLTTRLVDGVHLDDFLARAPSQAERDRAGTALFDFYYGALFHHGVYNCDPHPGNYLFCSDGRIAIVDHGCTRAFEPGFVANLTALTRAVQADDRELIRRALVELRMVEPRQRYDHARARRLLRWFYGPMLRDSDSAFRPKDASVDPLTGDKNLRALAIPGEFLFLVRMRVGIAAVLAQIGARTNWHQLQREYLDEATRQLAVPEPFAPLPAEFDVVLVEAGARVIEVVREIRDLLGIRVREAKELVDAAPHVVKPGLSRRQAADMQARLQAAGGIVELRQVS